MRKTGNFCSLSERDYVWPTRMNYNFIVIVIVVAEDFIASNIAA